MTSSPCLKMLLCFEDALVYAESTEVDRWRSLTLKAHLRATARLVLLRTCDTPCQISGCWHRIRCSSGGYRYSDAADSAPAAQLRSRSNLR